MSKWTLKATNDYLDQVGYLDRKGQRHGQVLGVPLPSRARWNARLAAYAPGCGSPTPYPGTSGSAPCGAQVDGRRHLCPHCAATGVVEALLGEEDDFDAREWLLQQEYHVPTIDSTNFYLTVEPDDHAPDWDRPDDNPEDARLHDEYLAEIDRRLEAGDYWAYGQVFVFALWQNPETGEVYSGWDYLGGCSYANAADFMETSGYFDDMMERAYMEMTGSADDEHPDGDYDKPVHPNALEIPDKYKQALKSRLNPL